MGPTGWTAWRRVASGSSPVRPAPSRPEPPCPAGPHFGLTAGVIPLAGNRSRRVIGWPRFCRHPGAGGNPTVRPFRRPAHPGSSPASAAPPDRSRSLCPPRPPARHRRGPVVSGEKDRAGRAAVSRTPETAPPDARRRLPVIVLQAGLRAFGSAGDGFTRRHRRACRIRARRAAMRNGDFAIAAHAGIRLRRAMAPYRSRLRARAEPDDADRAARDWPDQRRPRAEPDTDVGPTAKDDAPPPRRRGRVIARPVNLCGVSPSPPGKRIPSGAPSNFPGQARPCAGAKPPAAGPGRPECASSRLLPAQAQSRQAPDAGWPSCVPSFACRPGPAPPPVSPPVASDVSPSPSPCPSRTHRPHLRPAARPSQHLCAASCRRCRTHRDRPCYGDLGRAIPVPPGRPTGAASSPTGMSMSFPPGWRSGARPGAVCRPPCRVSAPRARPSRRIRSRS